MSQILLYNLKIHQKVLYSATHYEEVEKKLRSMVSSRFFLVLSLALSFLARKNGHLTVQFFWPL